MIEDKETKYMGVLFHFPYSDMNVLKVMLQKGLAVLRVDRGTALETMTTMGVKGTWLALFLSWTPLFLTIFILIYSILTKTMGLLLGIPLIWVFFQLFHPGMFFITPIMKLLMSTLNWIVIVYAVFINLGWLIVLSVCILFSRLSIVYLYRYVVSRTLRLAIENESFFYYLWNNNLLSIVSADGTIYWRNWYEENGAMVDYND